MPRSFLFILLTLIFGLSFLSAAQTLYVGPEIYHIKRIREGGTRQEGELYGAVFCFERLCRNGLFLDVEARWATGDLKGHTHNHLSIHSRMIELEAQGNLGYTLGLDCLCNLEITPYVGGGAFKGTNKFGNANPIQVKYTDRFYYFSSGILVMAEVLPAIMAGINFQIKWAADGQTKVSDDPDFEPFEMHFDTNPGYYVELPISYQLCGGCSTFSASILPFFEYRHYGKRENFPFDFLDTKYYLYGAKLLLGWSF